MKHLLALALLVSAAPAQAQNYIAFHSPSENIQCAIYGGDYAGARCDMVELTPSFTKPPPDCDFDWGFSFGVDPQSGKGYLACVSDAVADPAGLTLDYGAQIGLAGITCTSAKTGMRCTNTAGHGFAISKAKQSLF